MRKELKQGGYVLGVWLAVKVLSQVLSFNRQSELYTEYYSNLMPVSFVDILLMLYVLRTVIVFLIHFYGKHSVKE